MLKELPDLADFCGLVAASRIARVSTSTLRLLADRGEITSIRDPLGRRLLLRQDVERLAARRGGPIAPAER